MAFVLNIGLLRRKRSRL